MLFGCSQNSEPEKKESSAIKCETVETNNETNLLVDNTMILPTADEVFSGPVFTEINNGLILNCYENGQKKSEISFNYGIKEGPFKKWYSNGNLKEQGTYAGDKFHGEYKSWNEDGLLKISGSYFEGKHNGEWVFYDEEGNAKPSIFYKFGVEITRDLHGYSR